MENEIENIKSIIQTKLKNMKDDIIKDVDEKLKESFDPIIKDLDDYISQLKKMDENNDEEEYI